MRCLATCFTRFDSLSLLTCIRRYDGLYFPQKNLVQLASLWKCKLLISMQKVEEDKENLECRAQTEPGLQWQSIHKTHQHNAPSHATQKTEDAGALWWSSSPGARCFDLPPPASTSMPPPPYLSQNPTDTTGPSSSSAQLGNVKGFLIQIFHPLDSLQSPNDTND